MIKFARDVWVYLTREDRNMWFLLLVTFLVGGMARSLFLALVNNAVSAFAEGTINVLYILLPILTLVISLAADMFGTVRSKMVSQKLSMRMRGRLAEQIGRTNLRLLEREGVNGLHFRLVHTVSIVAESYCLLLAFCGAAVTLLFNTLYIGWLSPLALVVAMAVAAAGITTDWIFERLNTRQREALDKLQSESHDAHFSFLHGFKELHLSRAKSDDFHRQLSDLDRQIYEASVRATQVTASGTAATNLFEYLAVAIFGIGFSVLATVPPVTIMQLITAVLFTMAPLSNIIGTFPQLGRARIGLDKLKRLTALMQQEQDPAEASEKAPLPPFQTLMLKNVVLRLDQPDRESGETGFVLGPINLTIKRGELVCIVGGNGCGKTVLMRVLAGLYPVDSGEILFNGKVIVREDMRRYREQFSTVFNDFFLFKELLGQRGRPAAHVRRWLEYFGLGDTVTYQNGRFSTIDLSTGQRKRLALGVALLDERPILILDEFGAEQDPEHRDRFYRVWLPEIRKLGATVLLVSHDDAYFDAADVLVRMDYGKISEYRRVDRSQASEAGKIRAVPLMG